MGSPGCRDATANLVTDVEAQQRLFDRTVAELGDAVPSRADELAVAVWLHLYDRPVRLGILEVTRLARRRAA